MEAVRAQAAEVLAFFRVEFDALDPEATGRLGPAQLAHMFDSIQIKTGLDAGPELPKALGERLAEDGRLGFVEAVRTALGLGGFRLRLTGPLRAAVLAAAEAAAAVAAEKARQAEAAAEAEAKAAAVAERVKQAEAARRRRRRSSELKETLEAAEAAAKTKQAKVASELKETLEAAEAAEKAKQAKAASELLVALDAAGWEVEKAEERYGLEAGGRYAEMCAEWPQAMLCARRYHWSEDRCLAAEPLIRAELDGIPFGEQQAAALAAVVQMVQEEKRKRWALSHTLSVLNDTAPGTAAAVAVWACKTAEAAVALREAIEAAEKMAKAQQAEAAVELKRALETSEMRSDLNSAQQQLLENQRAAEREGREMRELLGTELSRVLGSHLKGTARRLLVAWQGNTRRVKMLSEQSRLRGMAQSRAVRELNRQLVLMVRGELGLCVLCWKVATRDERAQAEKAHRHIRAAHSIKRVFALVVWGLIGLVVQSWRDNRQQHKAKVEIGTTTSQLVKSLEVQRKAMVDAVEARGVMKRKALAGRIQSKAIQSVARVLYRLRKGLVGQCLHHWGSSVRRLRAAAQKHSVEHRLRVSSLKSIASVILGITKGVTCKLVHQWRAAAAGHKARLTPSPANRVVAKLQAKALRKLGGVSILIWREATEDAVEWWKRSARATTMHAPARCDHATQIGNQQEKPQDKLWHTSPGVIVLRNMSRILIFLLKGQNGLYLEEWRQNMHLSFFIAQTSEPIPYKYAYVGGMARNALPPNVAAIATCTAMRNVNRVLVFHLRGQIGVCVHTWQNQASLGHQSPAQARDRTAEALAVGVIDATETPRTASPRSQGAVSQPRADLDKFTTAAALEHLEQTVQSKDQAPEVRQMALSGTKRQPGRPQAQVEQMSGPGDQHASPILSLVKPNSSPSTPSWVPSLDLSKCSGYATSSDEDNSLARELEEALNVARVAATEAKTRQKNPEQPGFRIHQRASVASPNESNASKNPFKLQSAEQDLNQNWA